MSSSEAGVAEAARRSMSNLTPAERRVARALLAAYPVAGLETVAELARRAGVSGPTVIRFAAKLGYDSYMDFQRVLKDELMARDRSPALQISARPPAGESILARVQASCVNALDRTFRSLSPQDFSTTTELIADRRRPLSAIGGRFTTSIAEYLTGQLEQVRPMVSLVRPGPNGQLPLALDMSRRDVVVAFDIRRYQRETIEFARAARSRGAAIILVTDPWLSPIAEIAQDVLPVAVETVSPFDTLMPALAVADAIVTSVVERIGESAEKRVRDLDLFTEQHTTREPGP